MSIRQDILTLINSGVTSRDDILERLDIGSKSLNNSVRFLENRGWIECCRPNKSSRSLTTFRSILSSVSNSSPSYKMTEIGIGKMMQSEFDDPQKPPKRRVPDYDLMRYHLKVGDEVNDSQLIVLWNDTTDYYLPYEGDEDALRQIGVSSDLKSL